MFNSISIPTVSIILSLINALVTVFFVYNYKKTNDTKWLKNITSVIIIYMFVDLLIEMNAGISERITIIIHHIICLFFTLWARINSYGISILPEMVYAILVTESSTIFLNINKLIKIYLDSNSKALPSLTSILKNISTINYLFFLPLFVYFRNYKIFVDGIFNLEFYSKLLAPQDNIYHYLNRIVLLCLFSLSALNIYWLIPIFKSTYKKLLHLFGGKSDKDHKNNKSKDEEVGKRSNVDEFIKEVDVDDDDDDDNDDVVSNEICNKEEVNKEKVNNEEIKEDKLKKEEDVNKEEVNKEEVKLEVKDDVKA